MNRRELLGFVGAGFCSFFGAKLFGLELAVSQESDRILSLLDKMKEIAKDAGVINYNDIYHPEFVKQLKELINKVDVINNNTNEIIIDRFELFISYCKSGIINDPGVKFSSF